MKNKLERILGTIALAGIILIGVGAKTDNEKFEYLGTGIGSVAIGYAMIHYNQKKKRKITDYNLENRQ